MKKKLNICVVYNLKDKSKPDDSQEEYDEIETIEGLKEEIEKNGFSVSLLEQDHDFLKKMNEIAPDFVFNIAEGKGATRSRESQVPCMLESLNIPYSGSDPVALGITLDKYMTNIVLKAAGIPVPDAFMARNTMEIKPLRDIFEGNGAFIIKPRWEGSSKGIFSDSLVGDFEALERKAEKLFTFYSQPVIIEEFLEKDEITAGVYGNSEPRILGMMKIVPREKESSFFIYSIENKRDWERKIKYESAESIPLETQAMIKEYAARAFRALELRDVARIDFRLDKNSIPKIIDINPLPGLSPRYSDLIIMYRLGGGEYPSLINKILTAALTRNGFEL
ncbi:MAG: ATP-grasp domain-containing protein [Candidatus Omnitrophota bacterium]